MCVREIIHVAIEVVMLLIVAGLFWSSYKEDREDDGGH